MLICNLNVNYRHSAVLIGSTLFIFGGWDAPDCNNDIYSLDMGKLMLLIILPCCLSLTI